MAEPPPTDSQEAGEAPLRRDIGRIGLLFAGVGSIIGSGWLFGALEAANSAGPAAIFSSERSLSSMRRPRPSSASLCRASLTVRPSSGGTSTSRVRSATRMDRPKNRK